MSVEYQKNSTVSCKCYSFDIKKQAGIAVLHFSDFEGDKAVHHVGKETLKLSDYEGDPRFPVVLEFLQELADSVNPRDEDVIAAKAAKQAELEKLLAEQEEAGEEAEDLVE